MHSGSFSLMPGLCRSLSYITRRRKTSAGFPVDRLPGQEYSGSLYASLASKHTTICLFVHGQIPYFIQYFHQMLFCAMVKPVTFSSYEMTWSLSFTVTKGKGFFFCISCQAILHSDECPHSHCFPQQFK